MLTFTLETRKPRWREIMIKHDWERSKGEERGDGQCCSVHGECVSP